MSDVRQQRYAERVLNEQRNIVHPAQLDMHLTLKGRVLCGDERNGLHRIHAASIKMPLRRSQAQVENWQRAMLSHRSLCDGCWQALQDEAFRMAEELLQRVLDADAAREVMP